MHWPTIFKNRTQWVRALRSGKYLQGKGKLVTPADPPYTDEVSPQFCCLGVAATCLGISLEGIMEMVGDIATDKNIFLDRQTQEAFGLTRAEMSKLANLNDQPVSFQTIADQIEHKTHILNELYNLGLLKNA